MLLHEATLPVKLRQDLAYPDSIPLLCISSQMCSAATTELQCYPGGKNILTWGSGPEILKSQIDMVRPIFDQTVVDQVNCLTNKKTGSYILTISYSYHPDSTVLMRCEDSAILKYAY